MMHCSDQHQWEPVVYGRNVMAFVDHVCVVRREERWLSHYCSEHGMLLVGEGDFSFSASLANAFGTAYNIVATSLDSPGDLNQKYGASAFNNLSSLQYRGAQVYHGVDACSMASQNFYEFGGRLRLFDRIIYNFPHAGFSGKEDDELMIGPICNFCPPLTKDTTAKHKELVLNFFRNAVHMLLHGGEVHVTHKYGDPYDKWRLVEQAERCGLVLQSCTSFYLSDFPGYCNRRGAGSRAGETFEPCKSATFIFVARGLGKKKQTLNVLLKEPVRGSLRKLQQPGNKHAESSMKAEVSAEEDQSRRLICKTKSEKLSEKSRQKLPVPIEASAPRRTKRVASAYAEGRNVKNRGQLIKNEKLEEEIVKEVEMECETSFSVTIFDHTKNCVSTFADPYAAAEVMKEGIVRKGLASSGTCPLQVVSNEIVRLTKHRKHGGLSKKKQTSVNVMELILKELATRSLRTLHQPGNQHADQSSLKVEETFRNREQLKPEELVQMVGMECETSFSVTIFDHTKNCVSTFADPYAAAEVMKEGIVRKGLASSGTCPLQVVSNEIVRLTKHRKHGGLSKKKQTSVNVMELILKELATRSLRTLHQPGNQHADQSSLKVEETFRNREQLKPEELVQMVGMECETSFSVTIFDHTKNCVSAFADPYAAAEVMKEGIVRKGLASSGTCPLQVVSNEIVRLTKHRKHGGLSKKKQTSVNVMELILKELATRSLRTLHQPGNQHADQSSLKVEETFRNREQLKPEELVQMVGMECETSFSVTIFDHTKNCVSTFADPYAAAEVMKEGIVRKGLASSGTCPLQVVSNEIVRLTKHRKHGGLSKKKQTSVNVMELILKELATRSLRTLHQPGNQHADQSSLKVEETFRNREQLKPEELVQMVGMECETSFSVTIFDHTKNCVSAFADPYAAAEVMKEGIVRKGLASSGTCPLQVVSNEIVRLTKHRKHGGLSKKKQTSVNVMELILKELATRSLRTLHQPGNQHADQSSLKVEETFRNREQLKPEELVQMVGMECETSFSVTIFDHTKNCVSTFADPYAAAEVMKEGIVRKGLASSGTCPLQVVSNEIVRLTKHRKHGGLSKKKQTSVNVMELILKELATRSLRTLYQLGKIICRRYKL